MNHEQILQVYRLRIFIETEMIKDTRWPSEDELNFMDKKYDQFHDELAAGHLELAHELYRDLYFARVELSRLDLFSREAKRLFQQTVPYRMANFAARLAEDSDLKNMRKSDGLLQSALRAHDAEALTACVLGTLTSTIEAVGRLDIDDVNRRRGRGRKLLEAIG
jgi:DNA-binding GntR family transcriptional regulator